MAKKANPGAGELPGMPDPDGTAVLAKEYLNRKDEVDAAKDKMETAGDALAEAMRDEDRREIVIGGIKIILSHLDAADILKVKHPRGQGNL